MGLARDVVPAMRGFALLCLVLSGCSMLPTQGHRMPAEAHESAGVTLFPWLGNPFRIALDDGSGSLISALGHPEVAEHRLLLSGLARRDRDINQVGKSSFEDDCAVLLRGNENWYFLEPWELLEGYAGFVPLSPENRVLTLPFESTRFCGLPRPSQFEYSEIDSLGVGRKISVAGQMGDDSVGKYLDELQHPAVEGWTATVLSRWDGQRMHHLVLPANAPASSPLAAALSVRKKLDRVFLQPGDVVVKTNLVTLAGER
jgi:hypothetical protein